MKTLLLVSAIIATLAGCSTSESQRRPNTAIEVLRMTDDEVWALHYRTKERLAREAGAREKPGSDKP